MKLPLSLDDLVGFATKQLLDLLKASSAELGSLIPFDSEDWNDTLPVLSNPGGPIEDAYDHVIRILSELNKRPMPESTGMRPQRVSMLLGSPEYKVLNAKTRA